MEFTRIPLEFSAIDRAYRDYRSLPHDIDKWIKDQNAYEDKENERRTKQNLPLLGHSTSCCMQASLSFNATGHPIPKAGSRDRQNTTLDGGRNYILAVDEFRAYLTYKYGPTEQVNDLVAIQGRTGVLIFGNSHIEFWDGQDIFQSTPGAKRRAKLFSPVNGSAIMGATILNARPRWFWSIGQGGAAGSTVVPDWLQGWWTVYDGNYYYYYFAPDGIVNYIKTKPNPKWVPPKAIGNQGKVTMAEHGPSILWTPTERGGEATKEDFTRLNWTSTTEMNGRSSKYAQLFARKM